MQLETSIVQTYAGTGAETCIDGPLTESAFALEDGLAGSQDGQGTSTRFSEPSGLSAMGSHLYIADTNNHAIRCVELDTLTVTTLQFPELRAPDVCIPSEVCAASS